MKLAASLLFVSLTLIGAGCAPYAVKKQPLPLDATGGQATEYTDQATLDQTLDKIREQALQAKDPKICLQLPLKGVIWAWQDDGYGYNPTLMRWECLSALYSYPTAEICRLLDDVPEEDSYISGQKQSFMSDCYLYAAQVENNNTLCDQVTSPDGETYCLALVTKEADRCLSITNLREDQKIKESVGTTESAIAYITDGSYSAATCIQAVAYQTRDHQVCALIDGVRFGENWTRSRNHCLEIAGYRLSKQGKPHNFCDAYVEDHSNIGSLSWGARMNCQMYGATIDPNDFWKIEKPTVLHIPLGTED